MSTEIEKLPRLIERAANALAKASTAGEVLEAKSAAGVAYDAAKIAERLAKYKKAHEDIIAIIRKTQADALVIEARAQCRLADEYDAAQERGDVQKQGGDHTSKVLNKNLAPTLADIGITKKEVHEARQVRDAEKQKPGMVRKMLDKQLEAGEEVTRADVKRAVKETMSTGKKTARSTYSKNPPKPVPLKEIDAARGRIAGVDVKVGPDTWKLFNEKARAEGKYATAKIAELVVADVDPEVDVKSLPMSAQEKVAAAIRQEKKKLALEFSQRVQDEVRRRIDEMILPNWKDQIEQAKTLYERRRALMTKDTFNTIRRGLHPDSRGSISDKKLAEAFDAFMKLEKYLLDEKDSPTEFGSIPSSLAEWDRMKAKGKTKRGSGTVARR